MARPIALLLSLPALALVAACSRTPPEPAPASSVSTPEPVAKKVDGSSSAGAAARCITPLVSVAPTVPPPAGKACPADPEPGLKLPIEAVTFPDAAGTSRVEAELVKSEHDVERGLMYRTSMADDRGMLFKLDGRRDHTFWMHNTCISLDMLFIDDDGVIVGVSEAAPTLSDDVRSVGCPSVFVLEVNGGWVRKHGVKPGQKITIPFAAR